MARPICQNGNCNNLCERYTGRDHPHYRKYCNTHRRRINGRLTGWERAILKRRKDIANLGTECSQCKTSGPKGFLDVHHKDRNHRNNDISNLELLCPNCHRLADLALHSGKSVVKSEDAGQEA